MLTASKSTVCKLNVSIHITQLRAQDTSNLQSFMPLRTLQSMKSL